MIFCYPGTFVVREIHGNVFLFSAYRVQRTKLNKNNFCVSRSRLGGDTENSSCEEAYIMQLSRNLLGLIHVYAQDNRAKYLLDV